MPPRWLVCPLVALLGCDTPGPSPEGEPHHSEVEIWQDLTDPTAWTHADDDDDPLPEHQPETRVCSPQPWHAVGRGIEADTGQCNYLSLTTALGHGFAKGDTIEIDVWWNALASVDPAQGHLALFVGGQPLWETHVDIPGPADSRSFEFTAAFDAAVGEDVLFHLHNHGFNTWTLARLAVLDSPQ